MKETKNTTFKQRFESIRNIKSEVKYIFRDAREHKTSFKDILNTINDRIYTKGRYKTLPMYERAEINGYINANFDVMYEHVVWCHWYNDVFVGRKLEYGKDFKQDKVKSNYVYIGTEKIYS